MSTGKAKLYVKNKIRHLPIPDFNSTDLKNEERFFAPLWLTATEVSFNLRSILDPLNLFFVF